MDLSNSVIMPREDFYELQASACTPATTSQRIAGTIQTAVIFGSLSAAFTAGVWSWAKAVDWLEERQLQRKMRPRTQPTTPR